MKQINSSTLAWCMSVALLSGVECKAETKVPCIIASGNAEAERCVDLASFNRITFGENSMVISSSRDASKETVELLYTLYNHLEIGDGIPEASVEVISEDTSSHIYVDAQSKLLHFETTCDSISQVGVFDISGNLLMISELSNGDTLMLNALSSGVYIAVASDGKTQLKLKFILK